MNLHVPCFPKSRDPISGSLSLLARLETGLCLCEPLPVRPAALSPLLACTQPRLLGVLWGKAPEVSAPVQHLGSKARSENKGKHPVGVSRTL